MALKTPTNAAFASNRTGFIFSKLPVYPAFSPTCSQIKYRHLWHGNQGYPYLEDFYLASSKR